MIERSSIGFKTAPTEVLIDAWRVQLFCKAIGEENPIHWDLGVAESSGLKGCPVPPTFIKAIEGEHFSSAAILEKLAVPMQKVLHAEQTFGYHSPLYVGETVSVNREIVDIYEKKNGQFVFIVVDTTYRVRDRIVATSCQTILTRQ